MSSPDLGAVQSLITMLSEAAWCCSHVKGQLSDLGLVEPSTGACVLTGPHWALGAGTRSDWDCGLDAHMGNVITACMD